MYPRSNSNLKSYWFRHTYCALHSATGLYKYPCLILEPPYAEGSCSSHLRNMKRRHRALTNLPEVSPLRKAQPGLAPRSL